jgi:hypothetical protein
MSTTQELGISKERMMEIQDLIIKQVESMMENKEELDTATIVKRMAGVPNDMEEALLIGITLGESMIAMKLGPLDQLAIIAGKF